MRDARRRGVAPWENFFRKISQMGNQRKFFELNLEMFLKNFSFGPPFEISIEFRQKSLKIMIFVEKQNFKQNFGDFAKNCPLNPMSSPRILEILIVSPSLA
jgi:hypothetical protein